MIKFVRKIVLTQEQIIARAKSKNNNPYIDLKDSYKNSIRTRAIQY